MNYERARDHLNAKRHDRQRALRFANLLQSLPSDLIDDSQSSSFQFPLSILYSQQQPLLTCSYVQQRRQWLWRDRPAWDSEFSRRSVGLDRESFVQGKPLSPSCSSTTASANKKSFPELNQWIIAECVSFWRWWWWWPIYRSHVDGFGALTAVLIVRMLEEANWIDHQCGIFKWISSSCCRIPVNSN